VRFEVRFRPRAEADLFALYRHIAEQAGHATAGEYIDRIEAACVALETFPERGTRRDDIRPGLRTMGFERRATIVFQVIAREVVIIRIFYGGQDFEQSLTDPSSRRRRRSPRKIR
jgi:toxin ParE1/3/4